MPYWIRQTMQAGPERHNAEMLRIMLMEANTVRAMTGKCY